MDQDMVLAMWTQDGIEGILYQIIVVVKSILGGGFKDFLLSTLFGADFHFDKYFSDGLGSTTNYSHYKIVKVPYIGPDWPWRKTTAFQVSPGPVKWMCFPNRKTPIGIAIDLYLRRCASESEESDDILIMMIGTDWKW